MSEIDPTPELFIPRRRLMLPLGLDDLVDVEIIRDSNPRLSSFAAAAVIKIHYPHYPLWKPHTDGTSGTLHVCSADIVMPSIDIIDGTPTGPAQTDGHIFRPSEPTIFTLGVKHDSGDVHVWWGAVNFDLAGETPPNVLSIISYIDNDAYRSFDISRFPITDE